MTSHISSDPSRGYPIQPDQRLEAPQTAPVHSYADQISNSEGLFQRFLFSAGGAKPNIDPTDSGRPILAPPDRISASSASPFSPSWQVASNQFFKESVEKLAASPQAAQALLKKLLSQEGVDSLSGEEQALFAEACQETRAVWQLPATWTFGSSNPIDWTPIRPVTAPPVDVELATRLALAGNLQQLCDNFSAAATKVAEDLPAGDPNKVAVAEITLVIAQALSELRQILQEIQLIESTRQKDLSQAKTEQFTARSQELDKALKNQLKMIQAQKKADRMSKSMKTISLAVSVTVIAIGVIALPFTAGGSTPLIIAGLAMSSAMLAYTVADSQYGLTQQLMNDFNTWIANSNMSPEAKLMVKATILTAAIIVLLAAVLAGGAGETASFATQVGVEFSKQAAVQASIMFIMSSNILPELVVSGLVSAGAIDEEDEKTKMITQIIVMAMTMVAVISATSLSMSPQSSAEGATTSFAQSMQNAVSNVKTALVDFGKSSVDSLKLALENIQKALRSLMTLLANYAANPISLIEDLSSAVKASYEATVAAAQAMMTAVEKALQGVKEAVKQIPDLGSKLMDKAIQLCQDLMRALEKTRDAILDAVENGMDQTIQDLGEAVKKMFEDNKEQIGRALGYHQDMGKVSVQGIQVYQSIVLGVLDMKMAKLLRELGNLEKAQEMAQLMITLFEQMLSGMQESLDMKAQWVKDLNRAMESVFGSATQTLNIATQQVTG